MGADEYHPIGHTGSNLTAAGGIGYTVVDSVDTMAIMGLADEYARTRAWISDQLRFDVDGNVSTFEVRFCLFFPFLPLPPSRPASRPDPAPAPAPRL